MSRRPFDLRGEMVRARFYREAIERRTAPPPAPLPICAATHAGRDCTRQERHDGDHRDATDVQWTDDGRCFDFGGGEHFCNHVRGVARGR